jgi:hypothetical protein
MMIDYLSITAVSEWNRFHEDGLLYIDNNPYVNSITVRNVNNITDKLLKARWSKIVESYLDQ